MPLFVENFVCKLFYFLEYTGNKNFIRTFKNLRKHKEY